MINVEIDEGQPGPAPPPIFVSNIENFIKFRIDLINVIGTHNFSFKATTNNFKILSENPDAYRKVIKHLKN